MSYKQFKYLYELAGKKGLTLAEYDSLYKECNGDYVIMKEKISAIDAEERSN